MGNPTTKIFCKRIKSRFDFEVMVKYDYRISISPFVFIMAGVVAIIITIITISFQSIKAAIANPVKSLRTEG